ncbi:MAG: translation elongation factor-like protein [Candidatus Hodarchaeales archaeon]|jgi:putative protease
MTEEELVGEIFTFFKKPSVAAIKVIAEIKIGDRLHIKGATTDFFHDIATMEIDRQPVESVTAGQEVGIKVPDRVRPGDKVYLVME